MVVIEGGWRSQADDAGHCAGRPRRRRSHGDGKVERERRRRAKRRRKRARACNRRRAKEVEGKYGYHTYHRCTSKHYYPTRECAIQAAKTCKAVFGPEFFVYHCSLCGGYHLTTHSYGEKRDETIGDTGALEGCRTEDQGD